MTRFEFKYTLNPMQEQALRSAIMHFMEPDPAAIEKGGWYHVTSLYFDTQYLSDYYDKSGGYLIRKKLRARIYTPFLSHKTPGIWLEIKKKYDMSFEKSRCLLSNDDWNNLMRQAYTPLLKARRPEEDRAVLHEFIWYLLKEGRSPAFFIRYRRHPYRDTKGDLRITFDSRIETCRQRSFAKPSFTKRVHKETIMEIKYSKDILPAWLATTLRLHNLSRDAFSKYGMAVEELHRYNALPR